MKIIKQAFKYMAMAAAVLPMGLVSLTSCNNDEDEVPFVRNEVKFTTAISSTGQSRAGEAVAYTPAAGSELSVLYGSLKATQKGSYVYSDKGWSAVKALSWDGLTASQEGGYTFYAVAPAGDYGAVRSDQNTDAGYAASDLLVARSTVDAKNEEVRFVLEHVLGQLEVNVQTTNDETALTEDELAATSVTIGGLKTAYTLTEGITAEVPATAVAKDDPATGLKAHKDGNVHRFVAPAQEVDAEGLTLDFSVMVNGKAAAYTYKNPQAFNLVAGQKTVFNITVSKGANLIKYRDDLIYVPIDTEGNTYPYFKVLKPSGMPDLIKWMNGEDINLDNVQYIPDELKYAQEPTDEQRLAESITLDCDLDYSSVETTKFQVDGENFEYNFIPLGYSNITALSNQLAYTGLFDGKNKTITGVKMILPGQEVGIIGWLSGENSGIKDLHIVGANIQGNGRVGAAVGCATGGTISGITVDNTSSMLAKGNYGSDVGGIAGFVSETTVENCSNAASVKGLGTVGGIVGSTNSRSIIRRCINSGAVEMTHLSTVGGITALASGGSYVMACTNTGTVSDTSIDVTSNNYTYIGGIVGENAGVVLLCNNTGEVKNVENDHVEFLGGIVGSHSGYNQSTFINQGFLGGCWTTFGKTVASVEHQNPHMYYNYTTDGTHSDVADYVANVNTPDLVDKMNSGVALFNSHESYPDCGYKWQTGTDAPVMVINE